MDIMRLLTRKLKSQSLEAEEQMEEVGEVEEVEEEEGSEGRRTFPEQRRNNDTMQATEFDSGTASDEDVTEFEEAPPCLRGIEAKLNCQVVQMSAQTQMNRTTTTIDPGCFSSQPNATSYSSSVISPQNVVSSVMTMPPAASKDSGISSSSPSGQAAAVALTLVSGRLSAVSSDLEWCSLDFEPPPSSSSCSSEMDEQHSSEEELVSIYRHNEQKRKHSQMSPNDNQCTSGEEEEDEEERFHRNCDHHRPLSPSNHRCLHGNCLRGNVGIPISAFGQTTAASDFASPRKRHRQMTSIVNSTTAIQQQQQRPSLDLYKMQKTSITRKYNNGCTNIASTNCRPRVVKIRTITGSSRPAKSAYNPSVFSFRSISWASSRLKEEPFRAF